MNARTCTPRNWALLLAAGLLVITAAPATATPSADEPAAREHVSRLLPASLTRSLFQHRDTPTATPAAGAEDTASLQATAAPSRAQTPTATPRTVQPVRVAEASAEPADRVSQIVDQIQQTYESVDDFQASFTQDYTSASLGETRTSEGRVFFRKPGMMRWDYRTPTQRFLISDGQSLWVYEPEFAQYYEQSLADSQLPTALRFLMGEGNLQEDFEISLRSEEAGRAVLDLVPRRSEGQVRRLRFTVDLDSGTVVETVIVDPLGNTNRLRFRDVRQNAGLPAANFSFSPPAGTTRITAPD